MGGKRKRAASRDHAAAGPDPELLTMLADAHVAVEQAIVAVADERPSNGTGPDVHDTLDATLPCGPGPRRDRTWIPIVDPLLLDRYQGLLVRSAVVAGSVHHLPSRLRERTEGALHELIVGVARDRAATGARVDALTDELLTLIGERIAQRVEEWRDPAG